MDLKIFALIFSLGAAMGADSADSEITRVQTLRAEERSLSGAQGGDDVYSINILPLVRPGHPGRQGSGSNELDGRAGPPPGSVPALFFLQRVGAGGGAGGALPDGIYYRPAKDQAGTPPPVIKTQISNEQAAVLAPDVSPYLGHGRVPF